MKNYKKTKNKQLGEVLIEKGIINHEQLQIALDHQKSNGGLFGEVLVELNFATERDIAQALTAQYGFPFLPLSSYEIEQEVVKSVPEDLCRKYCLIPIDKIGKSLTLAMSDPLNVHAVEEVEQLSGCMIQTFVSTGSDIKQSIDKYYKSS